MKDAEALFLSKTTDEWLAILDRAGVPAGPLKYTEELLEDPQVLEKSGGLYGSWRLAREYGFTDIDGAQPDLGRHFDFQKHFKMSSKTRLRWTMSRQVETQGEGQL